MIENSNPRLFWEASYRRVLLIVSCLAIMMLAVILLLVTFRFTLESLVAWLRLRVAKFRVEPPLFEIFPSLPRVYVR